MLKVRHQLTTNYFAQRLRAPHGRCHDCARARAEGSTAADSPRHAFGADNRVADVAGGDRSGVYNWTAVADLRSRGWPDFGGGHAGSDRLTRRTADRRSRSFRHAAEPVGSRYSDSNPHPLYPPINCGTANLQAPYGLVIGVPRPKYPQI